VLATLDHPGLAPLLCRFDAGLARAGDEGGPGYAIAGPRAERLVDALADAPADRCLFALAEAYEVLRYVHARGEVHPGLGPDAFGWVDGHVRLLWGRARPAWLHEGPPTAARDLRALGLFARTLLDGHRSEVLPELESVESAERALRILADRGVEVPRPMGTPACEHAEERLAAIADALVATRRPVLLTGPPEPQSIGLARLVLEHMARHETPVVDLSRAAAPALALHRLVLADAHAPSFDEAWAHALRRALEAKTWRGVVYTGHLDTLPGHQAAILRPLLEPLASSGIRVLASAVAPLPGALVLPCPIVRPAEVTADPSTPVTRLATLPPGIPARVVPAIPASLRSALPALARAGTVRFDQDGALHVAGPRAGRAIDPELAQVLRPALIDPLGEIDPLWRAAMWTRLGEMERAGALLRDASLHAAGREDLLAEVCRSLARTGHPRATRSMAELELAAGRPYRALVALRALPPEDPAVAVLTARALLRTGRPAEALEALGRADGEEIGTWWTAHAEAHLALGARDRAEEALAEAGSAPHPAARHVRLGLRARIALARLAAGETPADLAGLFGDLAHLETVPIGLQLTAARILLRLGESSRAAEVLRDAARASETSGAALLAMVTRLVLGRVAHRLGHEDEARAVLSEARAVARFVGLPSLERRALARLALLELERGDQEAAAAHRDALQAIGGPETPLDRALCAVVSARSHLARGDPQAALRLLGEVSPEPLDPTMTLEHALTRTRALLESGALGPARQLAEATPLPADPVLARRLLALRGRVHLALGRRCLDQAYQRLPDTPRASERLEVGEILLAWGGEDLEPEALPERVRALERARHLLDGPAALRAEQL